MKPFSYIFLLLFLVSGGCSSDKDGDKNSLDLGITEISFEAQGGSQEIKLPLNGNWEAVSNRSWCTVEKTDMQLKLTVPLNLTIVPRSAVITLTAGNGEGSFTVTQAGSKFNVFPEKLYLPASGKGLPIVIRGNVDWQSQADESWCHTSIKGDSLIVSADPYKDEQKARYARLTIQVDRQTVRTIPVIQIHYKNYNLEKWSDTNEGATLPATPENLSGRRFKETWGNYYQWGRNVGFSQEDLPTLNTITADPSITAAQAQEMPEFICDADDWLRDGSATTRLATTAQPYTWIERSGSNPCTNGYRLPLDYECLRIFTSKDLAFQDRTRLEGKEVLDAIGTEYDFIAVGNGASKAYILKMYGTADAYVLKYEFKGIANYNGWIRVTEIKGGASTDFQDAAEAEALFSRATESVERCFPLCGILWGEDASMTGNNGGSYWTAIPSYRYRVGAHAMSLNNTVLSYGMSYRRSLGCMIRGIKE